MEYPNRHTQKKLEKNWKIGIVQEPLGPHTKKEDRLRFMLRQILERGTVLSKTTIHLFTT